MNAREHALRLHEAGLSVFPVPYGYKTHASFLADNGRETYHAFRHSLFQQRTRLDERAIGKVFQGRSNIAVAVKDNLAVLDCETQTAAAWMKQQLEARKIPVYGWHTARGAHFLIRIRGAVKVRGTPAYNGKNSRSKHMASIEVRGTGGYIIAAGSLHPSGAFYRWFDDCADSVPTIDAGALAFLTAHDGTPFALNVTIRGAGKAQAYLEGGRISEGGRNNALFTAAMSLRGQGVTLDEALKQLVPAAVNRDGLSEHEARATIKSIYTRESTQGGQRSQRADSDAIKLLEAFAQGYDWKAHGRAHRTDKAVFEALIQRARMTSTVDAKKHGIRASVRELAGIAHITHKTAIATLRRLTERGLIERVKASHSNLTGAASYRFTVNAKLYTNDTIHTALFASYGCYGVISLHPDMLERDALGRVGATVYAALAEHTTQSHTGMTAREIAARVGARRETVYRLLSDDAKLIKHGFVECIAHDTPRRYIAHILTPTEQLERIPEGQQAARARRARHDNERVRYLEHKARSWRERFDRVNLYALESVPAQSGLNTQSDTATVYTLGTLQQDAPAAQELTEFPNTPTRARKDEHGNAFITVSMALGATLRESEPVEFPAGAGNQAQAAALSEFPDTLTRACEATAQAESWGALWARFSRAHHQAVGRIGHASSAARKHKVAFDGQGLRGLLAESAELIKTDSAAAFKLLDEVHSALEAFKGTLEAIKQDGRKSATGNKAMSEQKPIFDEGMNHVTA